MSIIKIPFSDKIDQKGIDLINDYNPHKISEDETDINITQNSKFVASVAHRIRLSKNRNFVFNAGSRIGVLMRSVVEISGVVCTYDVRVSETNSSDHDTNIIGGFSMVGELATGVHKVKRYIEFTGMPARDGYDPAVLNIIHSSRRRLPSVEIVLL